MRVLIIEDDPDVVEIVSLSFEVRWPNVQVLRAEFGQVGISLAYSENPDLIILDLGLPDMDGFDVCSSIRSSSDVPIVILTARDSVDQITKGLEVGADEYITKPFNPVELLARASTLLRSSHMPHLRVVSMSTKRNDVLIDLIRGRLFANHELVSLGPTEYRIIHYLVKNEGRSIPAHTLSQYILGPENGNGPESLEASFAILKKGLDKYPGLRDLLVLEPGEGYSFARGMSHQGDPRRIATFERAKPG